MTPDEFVADVMPAIDTAWRLKCLCGNPGFRKLLSFNFEDYGHAPMALIDSEIIGAQMCFGNWYEQGARWFDRVGDAMESAQGGIVQRYSCRQCGVTCESEFEDYSISMRRTYFRFLDRVVPDAPAGVFLVGIRAFSADDYLKVHDFREAGSVREFLVSIGAST